MIANSIYKAILRRPFFRGQDRIFNFLFSNKWLQKKWVTVKPIKGNFKIKCNTATWIGAKIVYIGDYESALKDIFKANIKKGDHILDVGANIGFHTLYFAELVGESGSVTAFEPVPYNFKELEFNINLNEAPHIKALNIALSNKNEQIKIGADQNSTNPGAYNLFNHDGNIVIDCFIGDKIIKDRPVNFIKIDVEGYESFVVDGLLKTIERNLPKIVFEFDPNYHQKTGLPADYIFSILTKLNYQFAKVYPSGPKPIDDYQNLSSGNIIALPHA